LLEVKEVPLNAVFGNELLALDEDKAVRPTCGSPMSTRTARGSRRPDLVLRLPAGCDHLDDTRAVAAFVTPNDPVVDGSRARSCKAATRRSRAGCCATS
jgi:hypothetical protein